MTPGQSYWMHGYRVAAPVPLPAVVAAPGPPDVHVTIGDPGPVEPKPGPGVVLLDVWDEDRDTYLAITRDGDTVTIRFYWWCEAVLDLPTRTLTMRFHEASKAGALPVVLCGTVMATLLLLDGHLVLHASAVRLGSRAVAFCGASGQGKSTTATLVASQGAALITDDVLRVDLGGGQATVWPGATTTRLRPDAAVLKGPWVDSDERSIDGRVLMTAAEVVHAPLPLGLIVIPWPDRQCEDIELLELPGANALARLAGYPRLPGWVEPRSAVQQFERLADLVEQIPVVEARIPWGPPFRDDLGARLHQVLDAAALKPA